MFECPNCGQNLKFDIASQQMACAYCDSQFNPYSIEKDVDAKNTEYFETTVFSCPQCGGEIFSSDNEAATFCLYCGGSTILTERISAEKRPKYIIPFKKTKEDCKQAYAKKMRGAFFVPKEYKDAQFIDGFRGVYMPYWTYRIEHQGNFSIMSETVSRKGDYIITNHYALEGSLKAGFEGDAYDAASTFYDDISRSLAPYDFVEQVDFTPSFLSGFYGDCADVEMDLYMDEAQEFAKEDILQSIKEHEGFREYTIKPNDEKKVKHAMKPGKAEADLTMYPVWFMSYRNNDRIAYATVNGQTGKVVADMPVDAKRYLLGSLLLAIPLFVLLNLLTIFNPKEILCVCAGLLLLSALMYVAELSEIYKRERFIHDKAMLLKKGRSFEYEEGKSQIDLESGFVEVFSKLLKYAGLVIWGVLMIVMIGSQIGSLFKYLIWPAIIIGTIICSVSAIKEIRKLEAVNNYLSVIMSIMVIAMAALVALVAPVHDAWYYGGAILTLFAVAFNFIEIIRNYNLLTTRKLPQFEKKGGDDYA